MLKNAKDLVFANKFSNHGVLLYIDNIVAAQALVNELWDNPIMMDVIRFICMQQVKYKFRLHVQWISTKMNSIADALSRRQINKFFTITSSYNIIVQKYPTIVKHFAFDCW